MGFLAPKPTQSQAPDRLTSIQVTQSTYGKPIPLVYGCARVPLNLIWYSDFTATPISSNQRTGGKGGGGGRSQVTSYDYSAALILLVCEGQIGAYNTLYMDKDKTTPGAVGFTQFVGSAPQSVWSHLTSHHSSLEQIPYDRTAFLAASSFQLGNSAALPNISVEVEGLVASAPLSDAEPSDILIDYCTHTAHGCGFNFLDTAQLTTGAASWKNYCYSMGYLFSPAEIEQRPAVDFINELCDMTNSAPVWSGGRLKIIPYGDEAVAGPTVAGVDRSYAPNLTPVYSFTDDDFLFDEGEDPVQITIKPRSATFNKVRVEILDRARDYNVNIVDAYDDDDILRFGLRTMPTLNRHAITSMAVGRRVAQIKMQRNLYIRQYYKFKTRADYCLLEPMDLVAITDSRMGLVNVLVRILEVDDSDDDILSFSCEEVPIGPAGAPLYNTQLAQGYNQNYRADPGLVTDPVIFQLPPLLVPDNPYTISIAVGGLGAMWGGCAIYASFDDLEYRFLGNVYGGARYGSLFSTLVGTGLDPDTTHLLRVSLYDTRVELNSGTTEDADELRTLCWVDGEILSYRDATLNSPGQYDLSYLRRAKYGSTQPAASSGSAKFVRLDQALFNFSFDPGTIGKTLYFKFQSFNIFGRTLANIASLSPYTYVIKGAFSAFALNDRVTLVPRGTCAVAGTRLFKNKGTSPPGTFDSDIYSVEVFTACSLSFRANEINTDAYVGINGNAVADTAPSDLSHAFRLNAGTLEIYNAGAFVASYGAYNVNQLFTLEWDGQVVRFYLDGSLLYQTPQVATTPQGFNAYFKTPGASIRDVAFGPLTKAAVVPFVARGQCYADFNKVGKFLGSAAWDSDVYSTQTFPNGCLLEFEAGQTNADIVAGLNTDPTTDQNFTGLDYAWSMSSTGAALTILESGASVLSVGAYTTTTSLGIKYDGQAVTYTKDGVIVRQVQVVNKAFFFDSSFFTPGGFLKNIVFKSSVTVPAVPFVARGSAICTNNTARIINPTGSFASGDVYSTQAHANGCLLSFQAEQGSSPVSIDVGINTDPLTNMGSTSIDWAWSLFSANCVILQNGAVKAAFPAHNLDTVLQIAYDGRFVYFIKDGVTVRVFDDPGKTFFMDSAFVAAAGLSAGVRNLEFIPFASTTPDPFVARGNCQVSGTNVRKVGGVGVWDSDVYSYVGYATCYVQFKSEVLSGNQFMIALNTDPARDQDFVNLRFAWYCDGSTGLARIYENGVEVGAGIGGSYSTDTVFAIVYDGTNVVYFKDDNVVRSVSAPGFASLYMDSSFLNPGSGCNSLIFGPGIVRPKQSTLQLFPTTTTNTFMTTQPDTIIVVAGAMSTTHVWSVTVPPFSRPYVAAVSIDFGINSGNPFLAYIQINGVGITTLNSVKKGCDGSNSLQSDFVVPAGVTANFDLVIDNANATGLFFSTMVMKAEVLKA